MEGFGAHSGRLVCALGALGVAASLVVAGAAAAPQSPAAFRATLNAYCGSLTPKFATIQKRMSASQKAGNLIGYFSEFGADLGLDLDELNAIAQAAAPAALHRELVPLDALIPKDNAALLHIITLLADGTMTQQTFDAALSAVQALIAPTNRALDAAGLRACGSGQT
jgi:hypothetical protein